MTLKIKKQINRKSNIALLAFTILSFLICFLSINFLNKNYITALADSVSEFASAAINADNAKDYITTRKKDDDYNDTLNLLCKYTKDNQKNVSRISVISFSNSAGYYIFDTGGETLGTKIDYDKYNASVKAELINGRNKWYHSKNGKLYSYAPLRTVDDRLAGYIITEIDSSLNTNCIIFITVGFCVIFLIGLAFNHIISRFMEKEVFSPIKKFSETALSFTGSFSDEKEIDTSVFFKPHKDNEIGLLGKAIQKMVSDINDSTKNLSEALHDAAHDGMTQVFNKRYYNNMLPEFSNCSSICVIYFDVNNLKLMNDTQGHESGDYVIKQAADYIRQFTSDSSFCFRMGGDEFLLVSRNCTFTEIDRIITRLDNDAPYILSRETDKIKCALSYGYSYGKGKFSYEKLLAEAEENMYAKKNELKKLLNMPDR